MKIEKFYERMVKRSMGEILEPSDAELRAIERGDPNPLSGSKDGTGAADHDQAYTFGRLPTSQWAFPFTQRQFVRLLSARGKVWREAEDHIFDHPNLDRFRLARLAIIGDQKPDKGVKHGKRS